MGLTKDDLMGRGVAEGTKIPATAMRRDFYFRFGKRTLDFFGAALGIFVLSPFLALIAIVIALTSRGPILFRQKRVGRGGRPFSLLKFRTMVAGAEARGGHITTAEDPRITPIGRWLRRWKLDEFPQLFNVFRGEMSLIGPRPQVEAKFRNLSEEEKKVLALRPGLTGLSALCDRSEEKHLSVVDDVEGYYVDRWLPRKVAQELDYFHRLHFRLDLEILLWTLVLVYSPDISRWQGKARLRTIFIDLAVFVFSVPLAYELRYEGRVESFYLAQMGLLMVLLPTLRMFATWWMGGHQVIWRHVSQGDLLRMTSSQFLLTFVLFALRLGLPKLTGSLHASVYLLIVPLSIIPLEFAFSIGGTVGMRLFRYVAHEAESRFRPYEGRETMRVVLVGAGSHGIAVAMELNCYPDVRIVGFVDDDKGKKGCRIAGIPVLGTVDELPHLLGQESVNRILICLEHAGDNWVARVRGHCTGYDVTVQACPSAYQVLKGNRNGEEAASPFQ